jgi:predicted metal-binding membrane protein
VVLLTALAWTYLVYLERALAASDNVAMSSMRMATGVPWHSTDVLFVLAMWLVMMIGMMTPSVTPMVLLLAGMRRRTGELHPQRVVLAFGTGYLVVWAVFSTCATLAQWAMHQASQLSPAMTTSSVELSGAILIAAGAYQLTPFKEKCLLRCQSPLGFLVTHWRDGTRGGLRMGIDHGVYCLGCRWALMCVQFVVGVMNLAWMAALSVFILVEKNGPAGTFVARFAGVTMVAAGVLVWSGWI